jgi:malic enzyme
MLKQMGPKPLILALANPEPEILPDEAKAVRPDAIIATGRSDYPNQVNNVLCFPFIFRGALDVGATTITEHMKLAAVHAIAELAQAEQSDIVAIAYGEQEPVLRSGIPDSEALRSALDRKDRAGRGAGRHGKRRGHPADRRFCAYRDQLCSSSITPA